MKTIDTSQLDVDWGASYKKIIYNNLAVTWVLLSCNVFLWLVHAGLTTTG